MRRNRIAYDPGSSDKIAEITSERVVRLDCVQNQLTSGLNNGQQTDKAKKSIITLHGAT